MVHRTACYKCGKPTGGRRKKSLCLSCYNANRPKGKNHPRWVGAGICQKCGGKKTANNKHCKICRKCWLENPPKGEKHFNFGRHLSDETKMKISIGNTGKRMGEDNHRFNPNKVIRRTYRFPYRKWRAEVVKLDGGICRICGDGPTNIVHHINPYKDNPENLDPNNGITLCISCHRKTYGKEYQFIDLFEEAIKKRVNSGEVQKG